MNYIRLLKKEASSLITQANEAIFIEEKNVEKTLYYYLNKSLIFLLAKLIIFSKFRKSIIYFLSNNDNKDFLKYDIERKITDYLKNDEKIEYKIIAINNVLFKDLKLNRKNISLYVILCKVFIEKKLYQQSLSFAKKILKLDPRNEYGYIYAIESLLQLNDHQVRFQTYLFLNQYFNQFRKSKNLLFVARKVFSHNGQSPKANNLFLNILKIFPKDKELLSCKNNFEEVGNTLESIKNEENNFMISEIKNNWAFYHSKISFFLKENKYDDAISILEDYLQEVHTLKIKNLKFKNPKEKALELIKTALILKLFPDVQSIYHLYLYAKQYSEKEPYLEELLINKGKEDNSFVWKACKLCRDSKDLKILFNSLRENGKIPIKYCRAYANAAQRAEEFEVAKKIYFDLIFDAIETLKIRKITKRFKKPSKSIGNYGTEALIDTVNLLNNYDIPHFAAAGTCLGIVREGRPIKHDQDIDIGIMEDNWDYKRLKEIIGKSKNFSIGIPHPKNKKIGAVHNTGITIDFFRFYKEKGKFWHNGVFVRWGNTPFELETRDLDGTNIQIPSGEKYLIENYGNWRKPDPLFNAFLNGPNKEVIWPEYYSAHILSSINLSIRRGQFEKALSIISNGIDCEFLNSNEKDNLKIVMNKILELRTNLKEKPKIKRSN